MNTDDERQSLPKVHPRNDRMLLAALLVYTAANLIAYGYFEWHSGDPPQNAFAFAPKRKGK